MFPIAGQTAALDRMDWNFLREPLSTPGVTKAKKIEILFSKMREKNFFKNSIFLIRSLKIRRATPGTSASF